VSSCINRAKVYALKDSKSINTILRSHIILFLFLLIFLVVLVVFVTLLRKASELTLRDKVHNKGVKRGYILSMFLCELLGRSLP
jgi:hypothetical protein